MSSRRVRPQRGKRAARLRQGQSSPSQQQQNAPPESHEPESCVCSSGGRCLVYYADLTREVVEEELGEPPSRMVASAQAAEREWQVATRLARFTARGYEMRLRFVRGLACGAVWFFCHAVLGLAGGTTLACVFLVFLGTYATERDIAERFELHPLGIRRDYAHRGECEQLLARLLLMRAPRSFDVRYCLTCDRWHPSEAEEILKKEKPDALEVLQTQLQLSVARAGLAGVALEQMSRPDAAESGALQSALQNLSDRFQVFAKGGNN